MTAKLEPVEGNESDIPADNVRFFSPTGGDVDAALARKHFLAQWVMHGVEGYEELTGNAPTAVVSVFVGDDGRTSVNFCSSESALPVQAVVALAQSALMGVSQSRE